MASLKHTLLTLAEKLNCEIDIHNGPDYGEIVAWAPDGYRFMVIESHCLVSEWDRHKCANQRTRDEAYRNVIEDLKWGIVACDCETCQLYKNGDC
jgi:hypothetical protein